jgi:nitrate reductase NapE
MSAEGSMRGAIVTEHDVTKGEERFAFVLLAVVLAPALTAFIVGGYGFVVWVSQLIMGPPTG